MTVRHRGSDAPSVWVLADDRAGNRSQALGVAEALEWPFAVREIAYGALAQLPNIVLGRTLAGLARESRAALAPPWPDLVIAAGRRTAPIARAIRKRSGGRAFLVQLMDPQSGASDFDLIAIPGHDRHPVRPNVIATIGAPHRMTQAVLARAAERWRQRFAALPRPRVALLVGGSTRTGGFTEAMAQTLGAAASRLAAEAGGSLLVSTSRRTGAAAAGLIRAIGVPAHVYRWGDAGDNPYAGYLALADAVIVTGDSMSMCTEACATRVPVYIYAPEGFASEKHGRLHRDLFAKGYARPLPERLEAWTHPPLNPADEVAGEIRTRLSVPACRKGQDDVQPHDSA